MLVVRTSPRAFALALIPLAGLHAILGIMGVIGHMAGAVPLPSPDRAFGIFALRLGIDAALLVLGHVVLQALRYRSRASYALMGGIAVTLGSVIAYAGEIWIASPAPGAVVTATLLPVVFGMMTGLLYGQFAARFEQAEAGPAPQPDALAARGPGELVDAEHPSRRSHAVVWNG